MENEQTYDCAIIGGGLAGLCLSIQLVKQGHTVVLFEKNTYPFHKVCGEYISKESWAFLIELGLPLADMQLPEINRLGISSTKEFMLEASLVLGGFGISRYTLDHRLSLLAKENGVILKENCKVTNCEELNDSTTITTSNGLFYSKIVCGSYGKHAPVFINKSTKNYSPNYIAVKYHIKTSFPDDRIELHNFKDGYCGISKVEDGKYCLCYLTTTKNLNDYDKDIKKMEEEILYKNPFLKKYFLESKFLFDKPLTISQITFEKKQSYSNGVFLLGDAAGAIAPLCGNGMSMAMRTSKILASLLHKYFKLEISKSELISAYSHEWDKNFSTRIKAGYYLQQLFGKNKITHLSLILLNKMPGLMKKIISLTHGKPF
ncbi:NAD(P)/FAD-dependent oxidoreductase [Aurantibacillus circumpalustris]|uniref:NAD(P)/FAD-dependent oxidoreductase n=1 Tax=Aurantibacillus circumpalustris TaxID=3036359 RepID=UPI00295BE1B1|nr:NAD(P)/FAD-dependent oxidoreductase [Aurantibacillus circumpalustris]